MKVISLFIASLYNSKFTINVSHLGEMLMKDNASYYIIRCSFFMDACFCFCFPVTPINQFLIILGRCTLYTPVCLQDEPTCMRIEPV